MAEEVQKVMEDMIPELEDLQQRGLLSKDEIKSVVSRRKDFEYKLRRRTALKEDYIRYINYEMNLEALKTKRRKRLAITQTGVSDYSSIKHITFIYERALRKFKGDIPLWLNAIKFGMDNNCTKMLAKTFARALQLHPRVADFWIHAASYEFEVNMNIGATRQLFLRGLRVNKTSKQLFLEYFRLEFLYVHKVITRRVALGIQAAEGATEGKDESAEESKATDSDVVNEGRVLMIVFKNAVAAVPKDLNFCFDFLQVAKAFLQDDVAQGVANTVIASILQYVFAEFTNDPEFWDRLAAFQFQLGDSCDVRDMLELEIDYTFFHDSASASGARKKRKLEKNKSDHEQVVKDLVSNMDVHDQRCCEVFLAAFTKHLTSDAVLEAFAEYVAGRVDDETCQDEVLQLFNIVVDRAMSEASEFVSSKTCETWIQLTAHKGLDDQVVAKCLDLHPDSAALWSTKVQLLKQTGADSTTTVREALGSALEVVPPEDSLMLNFELLDTFLQSSEETDDTKLSQFYAALRRYNYAKFSNDEDGKEKENAIASLLQGMVAWIASTQDTMGLLSKAFNKVVGDGLPPRPPVAFFQQFISVAMDGNAKNKSLPFVRRVFEKATTIHPHSHELWLDYVQIERSQSNNVKAHQSVLWRAKKAVRDEEAFELELLQRMNN